MKGLIRSLLVSPFCLLAFAWASQAPRALRCELLLFPEKTVITDVRPEFSWQLPMERTRSQQTAYQILVSSTCALAEKRVGDYWDSQRVATDQSVDIEYDGKPLAPDSAYYWQVRIWRGSQRPTDYSAIQKFRLTAVANDYSVKNLIWSDRYRLQTSRVAPVRVRQKRPGHYFIDFGRAAFGTVEIDLPGLQPTPWRVHLGEVLAAQDSIHTRPGGSRRYRSWTQPIPVGAKRMVLNIPADQRNTRGEAVRIAEEIGEVMPFRYCELENVVGKLSAKRIHQLAVHYPFDETAATFQSSSKILNDVWDLCKYSIKATSFLGVYIDGDRERIPYEGDAYINQLGHYAVDAEYSLARYTIKYLFRHPTWPAEWQMHMVMMAWADYLYTGNLELLQSHYEDLAAKTLLGLSREDGLIVEDSAKMTPSFLESLQLKNPPRILVDWPPASFTNGHRYGERDGYDMRPVNTVANAFHYHTLCLMALISEAIGRPAEAQIWRQRGEQVYRSFQRVFFHRQRGVYVDGESSEHSALHANFFPLAFGLVPPEQVERVVAFIKSRGMACSVYGSQHLLDALYQVGEGEYALSLLTATHDRSWAHMIYNVHSTITTEAWDNKYKENQDWNHAWGAAPANLIPRGLMGLQPLQAGCKKMRIRPQLGNLEFAEITCPTIRGAVHMRVDQSLHRRQLLLRLPAGMSAELHLAVANDSTVRENGRPVEQNPSISVNRTEAGQLVLDLASGAYLFQFD